MFKKLGTWVRRQAADTKAVVSPVVAPEPYPPPLPPGNPWPAAEDIGQPPTGTPPPATGGAEELG